MQRGFFALPDELGLDIVLKNASRFMSRGLDSWDLMAKALRLGKRSDYVWSFRFGNQGVIVSGRHDDSGKKGQLALFMDWPIEPMGHATGLMWIQHPEWDDVILRLMGTPMQTGGWIWRWICPLTNRAEQMVYFDWGRERFVSRQAVRLKLRPRKRPRIMPYIRRGFRLNDRFENASDAVGGKPSLAEALIANALEKEYLRLCFAENNLPEPQFEGDFTILPEITKRRLGRDPRAARWMYYRDRAGVLKMKAAFKQRFGLFDSRTYRSPRK